MRNTASESPLPTAIWGACHADPIRREIPPPARDGGHQAGRLAAHDPRFVLDLRMGREPRDRTEQRIRGFMAGFEAAREAARPQETAHVDETALPRVPRARRTAADRLRAALSELHAHRGQVLTHTEKAWASTFAGTRHSLAILFAGDEAMDAGEEFVAALPDHEFAIPGQLVADAGVVEVEHRLIPEPRLVWVQCELLLLEEG